MLSTTLYSESMTCAHIVFICCAKKITVCHNVSRLISLHGETRLTLLSFKNSLQGERGGRDKLEPWWEVIMHKTAHYIFVYPFYFGSISFSHSLIHPLLSSCVCVRQWLIVEGNLKVMRLRKRWSVTNWYGWKREERKRQKERLVIGLLTKWLHTQLQWWLLDILNNYLPCPLHLCLLIYNL